MRRRPLHRTARIRFRSFWLIAAWLFVSTAWSQEPVAQHFLSFPDRQNQYLHVTLNLPVSGDVVELAMPNWTPGSYVIRNFAGQLEQMRATDVNGRPAEIAKVAKNRWRLRTGGAGRITVDYDIWAGELHVSTPWVESGLALINGAGVFLYSEESLQWPQQVELELPGQWPGIFTTLPRTDVPNRFLATDYDELVDSPILAGNVSGRRFEVEGQGFELVNVGATEFWDTEKAVDDLSALVRAQQNFWGINPFDRDYLFFNFLLTFKGGLEHDHSTVMMSDRWVMRDRLEYIKWLALASHELFHAWNVRRMRPRALAAYDYDEEVYTRELWLAEGITSYYDNLLLFRAGLVSVNEYLDILGSDFRNYETVPGREIGTVESASFDSWIKHYVPDANSVNSTVSYYRRGALIGFVTDAAIRRETEDRSSLDDVMLEMYRRFGPGGTEPGGYPPGAFEDIIEAIAGPDVRSVVETLLRTRSDPDVDTALDYYGLKLVRDSGPAEPGQPAPVGFGMSFTVEDNRLIIDQVVRDGTAAAAGVIPGDEWLAINGQRVLPDTVENLIGRLRMGDRTELTLVRHGRLLNLTVPVQYATPETYVIMLKYELSRFEKSRLQKWLGRKLSFSR
jgi:predicted metalloprotease with PDZ domain